MAFWPCGSICKSRCPSHSPCLSAYELAARLGQSRAAVINLAVFQSLENGLRIDGELS